MSPKLSVVVINYNMTRELPRTIRSLSPAMQLGLTPQDYEVIVVDNGSSAPIPEAECRHWIPDMRLHKMVRPGHSPVPAVNQGISLARGELIAVFIDGARMASPGILSGALNAARLHGRPVIGTLAFHLGPDHQRLSMENGYDQVVEDELLAGSGWEEDGYRLFSVSAFAGSSSQGWFVVPNETNALFLRAAHWAELGGLDPGFTSVGGGFANLDIWARACADPAGQVIMLLGEATFHQFHGGVATNSLNPPKAVFKAEYQRLRGRPFARPTVEPWFFGRLNRPALDSIRRSLDSWGAWTEPGR